MAKLTLAPPFFTHSGGKTHTLLSEQFIAHSVNSLVLIWNALIWQKNVFRERRPVDFLALLAGSDSVVVQLAAAVGALAVYKLLVTGTNPDYTRGHLEETLHLLFIFCHWYIANTLTAQTRTSRRWQQWEDRGRRWMETDWEAQRVLCNVFSVFFESLMQMLSVGCKEISLRISWTCCWSVN